MIRRWLRALRPGWKLEASNSAPTWRMGSVSSRYGLPSILVLPAVGVTSPRSMRRVVVLPAPLGPRKPTTVPWSTAKLRSSTAVTGPKRLVSPSMVMTAIVSSSAPAGLLVEAGHVVGARHHDGTKRGCWRRRPPADTCLSAARRTPRPDVNFRRVASPSGGRLIGGGGRLGAAGLRWGGLP